MKFYNFMLAASALVMIQAPAHAACQDSLSAVQSEIGSSILPDDLSVKMDISNKLAQAEQAMAQGNDSGCESIVSDIRNEIGFSNIDQAQADLSRTVAADEVEMAMNSNSGSSSTSSNSAGSTTGTGTSTTGSMDTRNDTGATGSTTGDTGLDNRISGNTGVTGTGNTGVTGNTGLNGSINGNTGVTGSGTTGVTGSTSTGTSSDVTGMNDNTIDGTSDTAAGSDTSSNTELGAGTDTTGTGTTDTTLTVSEVKGLNAKDKTGEELGQVNNIVRNKDTGEVFVVISSDGFLGMGGDKNAVPLTAVNMDRTGATLDVGSKSELQAFEDFDKDRFETVEEQTVLSELNQ
jgi:hypothetical protein